MLVWMMWKRRFILEIYLEEIRQMNMKLCLIYNYAQHYRTSIFKLIDQEFDCDFVFGDSMGDVKKMDYALLKGNVKEVHNKKLGGAYFQKGVLKLLGQKYDKYIMLGETRCISTWIFLLLSKFYKNKNVYLWSHGWYGKETKFERIIKKMFFKLSDGIFLYGNYARELMIKEGFNKDRLFVIHNSLAYDKQLATRKQLKPTDIYNIHYGNNNPNLVFVGRLTEVKKLDMILHAMSKCKDKGEEYNLTLIGDGEKKEELEKLATELNLTKNVWFYGPCYNETELGGLIYNADLCVSPGNVGLTAMHSLVFGTPVITHNYFPLQMPEFESIREGETGTFFEHENIDSLTQKINEWFSTPRNREETRKMCMKEIDEYWTPYYQIEVLKKNLR